MNILMEQVVDHTLTSWSWCGRRSIGGCRSGVAIRLSGSSVGGRCPIVFQADHFVSDITCGSLNI